MFNQSWQNKYPDMKGLYIYSSTGPGLFLGGELGNNKNGVVFLKKKKIHIGTCTVGSTIKTSTNGKLFLCVGYTSRFVQTTIPMLPKEILFRVQSSS